MKTIIILYSILFLSLRLDAQSLDNFNSFQSYFSKTELPIDTRNYMKRKRGDNTILPENLNLQYICKNDSSKMHYYLELISDDTQEVTFSGNKKYVIGAADIYTNGELVFVTYQRARQDEGKMYYLASFSKDGILCDSLLVLSTNPEGDFIDWMCSKICNDKVIVFHYSTDFSNEVRTEILVRTFHVDKKGSFKLENQDVYTSNCSIDEFNGKSEKCIVEDPFNKY